MFKDVKQKLIEYGVTEEVCDTCEEIKPIEELVYCRGFTWKVSGGTMFYGTCLCKECDDSEQRGIYK